jgi:excisionase family DNA binding protein
MTIIAKGPVILDRDLMSKRRRRAYDFLQSAVNFAPSDELLDINGVAARLGIPKSTVYELTRHRASVRHSHPLPCFKVGRRLKFNWTTVMAWLTELEKGGVQ